MKALFKSFMLVLLVLTPFLTSCDKKVSSTHYVYGYLLPNVINLRVTNGVGNEFRAFFDNSEGGLNYIEDDRKLHEKHNDISYKGKIDTDPYSRVLCCAYDFKSIEIISDTDFDDKHPAGTALNDVVWYSGESLLTFIKSGYDKSKYIELTSVRKMVDKLTYEDLSCIKSPADRLEGICRFKFTKSPSKPATHNLTIKFVTDESKTIISRISMALK